MHPLTLADCEALDPDSAAWRSVVPVAMGTAPVEHAGKTRNVFVYGVTSDGPGGLDAWGCGWAASCPPEIPTTDRR